MQEIISFTTLLLLGSIGGLLAGLLGIGGGVVYVLIFSHYLSNYGLNESAIVQAIIANSMFAILFAGISGSYKQWKNKNFYPSQMFITGIAASLASIFFGYIISIGTWYTKERFTWLFISLLIFIAIRLFTQRNKVSYELDRNANKLQLFLTGLSSGTISAFSGLGGGVIIVPILTDLIKMPIKKVTSISLGVISIMAILTSLYNFVFHKIVLHDNSQVIYLSLALPVALGSLIAAPLGVQIASKISAKNIRIVFIVFLLLVITKMILF
jgi:uncharacterized membrane protein YfcA